MEVTEKGQAMTNLRALVNTTEEEITRVFQGSECGKNITLTPRFATMVRDVMRACLRRPAGKVPEGMGGERSWEWPISTVGKLISNLQTLSLEMPFYTAYFVEIDGQKVARVTHPSLSRETVSDGKIRAYSADNQSLVMWATAAPHSELVRTAKASAKTKIE
jgi:hypothetical protein